jgi:DNA-binding NarL/FixJ family response regulator
MKYFIVDDNKFMRNTIRSLVITEQDRVLEFDNAEELNVDYEMHHPDWILMDIQLPGVNGIQASEKLKKEFPDAHVIIVTQFDDKIFRRLANEAKADGYVLKDNLLLVKEIIRQANREDLF